MWFFWWQFVEFLSHTVTLCLTFWGTTRIFSGHLNHFTFLPPVYECPSFSVSWSTLVITGLSDEWHWWVWSGISLCFFEKVLLINDPYFIFLERVHLSDFLVSPVNFRTLFHPQRIFDYWLSLSNPLIPLQPQASLNLYSVSFVCLDISYRWGHIIGDPLLLTSYTHMIADCHENL